MKKLVIGTILSLMLTACGTAGVAVSTSQPAQSTPSVQSAAQKGEAYLAFTSDLSDSIVVTVDGREYRTETIQVKSTTSTQDIREMAGNIITLTPGTHEVSVKNGKGQQVYKQKISVTAQERKVVRL